MCQLHKSRKTAGCDVCISRGFRNTLVGRQVTSASGRDVTEGLRVPAGPALWYQHSNGLIEIAVNQGRADFDLELSISAPVGLFS